MTQRKIEAGDFRMRGEMVSLYVAVGLLAIVAVILIGLSLGLILIIILGAVLLLKIRQGQLLGQSVKVAENQLPQVYQAAQRAADRLDMSMPDVFVVQNPVINAFAMGFFGRKSVVLHSAAVEAMTQEELTFIVGHEFSHIKCSHTHWSVVTGTTGSVKIPILSDLIGLVFLAWSRRAEYSSDRGGLIVGENLGAAATALAKVAVGRHLFETLNVQGLTDQREAVQDDAISRFSEAMSTHPYIVNRIHALGEYSDTSEYTRWSSPPI